MAGIFCLSWWSRPGVGCIVSYPDYPLRGCTGLLRSAHPCQWLPDHWTCGICSQSKQGGHDVAERRNCCAVYSGKCTKARWSQVGWPEPVCHTIECTEGMSLLIKSITSNAHQLGVRWQAGCQVAEVACADDAEQSHITCAVEGPACEICSAASLQMEPPRLLLSGNHTRHSCAALYLKLREGVVLHLSAATRRSVALM
jgi:hypothetical protein